VYLTNSSEMSEIKQRTNSYYIKYILFGLGIAVAYTLILIMVFAEQDVKVNTNQAPISTIDDDLRESPECEGWLEVGKTLRKKNDNQVDVDKWLEEDRIRIYEIEELYKANCIATVDEVMNELKNCTKYYITVQTMIDKMEERNLGTLSEDDQENYNQNYKDYFDTYCNKIIDEIEKTDEFLEFNKTRGQ